MEILIDTQIREEIKSENLLKNVSDAQKSIKGCAADLHVGDIFIPGKGHKELGSVDEPRSELSLKEGETALIRTREEFNLGNNFAAFAFPANSVSIKGLLMTNPGHIDPGYQGYAHVTVINMGKEPFNLKRDDRLLRAIFIKFDKNVDKPFSNSGESPVTNELLSRLAPDFLSIKDRAAKAARDEVNVVSGRSQVLQYLFPFIAVIVTAYMTSYGYEERIKKLEEAKAVDRLTVLESEYPMVVRLNGIENQIREIKAMQGKSEKANKDRK